MRTTYQKLLFAGIATVAVCGVIYFAKALPDQMGQGTDYGTAPWNCQLGTVSNPVPWVSDGSIMKCGSWPTQAATNFGYPTTRSLSLATAYQCTDNTKPCIVTVNIQSTASITLSGGQTNTGNALVGSTNAVASGTGSVICVHGNSNTGTLTVGLGLNTIATTQCTIPVPAGGYFAVRQIAGTISIISAFDQQVG